MRCLNKQASRSEQKQDPTFGTIERTELECKLGMRHKEGFEMR